MQPPPRAARRWSPRPPRRPLRSEAAAQALRQPWQSMRRQPRQLISTDSTPRSARNTAKRAGSMFSPQ
eukprot:2264871-Pyramimonas_sp.AAC.1